MPAWRSSWGACGSSSKAVSIQNVPVDTTTPADNQVITYVASLGEYKPKAGGGVTAGMQAVKYATDFSWSQSPATDLSAAGTKTVKSRRAPAAYGTEPWYYVYIRARARRRRCWSLAGPAPGTERRARCSSQLRNAHRPGTRSERVGRTARSVDYGAIYSEQSLGAVRVGKSDCAPGRVAGIRACFGSCFQRDGGLFGIHCRLLHAGHLHFSGDPSNAKAFLDITLLNPRGRPYGGERAGVRSSK